MALLRRGTPATVSVGGLTMIDCTSGAYEVVRTSPMSADAPYSLWALCEHNTNGLRSFYNGPEIYVSQPVLAAYRVTGAGVYSGSSLTTYTQPSTRPVRSYEWSRTGPGSISQVMQVYEDGVGLTIAALIDKPTDASGAVFAVGAIRNTSGALIYGKLRVRDVVLTQGWTLTAAQRAALDSYRQARLAG